MSATETVLVFLAGLFGALCLTAWCVTELRGWLRWRSYFTRHRRVAWQAPVDLVTIVAMLILLWGAVALAAFEVFGRGWLS